MEVIVAPAAQVYVAPKKNQSIVFATLHGHESFGHEVRGGAFTQRYEIIKGESKHWR